MKRFCRVVACVFASLIALSDSLVAAQTNVTVLLTNQCQVTGFLVSQSSSNVVVSVGGRQRMTFVSSEISSLALAEVPAIKMSGPQQVSGGASNAPTRVMLALTNGSLVAGVLVSQSASNFVVSTGGGQRMNIARSQVNWFELKDIPISAPPGASAMDGALQTPRAVSHSIADEFNKPHTEDEMRAMLKTPEGAALLKSVCDQYIGAGADAQTKAATEFYFKTLQDFEGGKIGIADIQSLAQTALGTLNQRQQGSNSGSQADLLNEYQQILQGFIAQPAPAPVQPVQ